jgi:hypothetical protein
MKSCGPLVYSTGSCKCHQSRDSVSTASCENAENERDKALQILPDGDIVMRNCFETADPLGKTTIVGNALEAVKLNWRKKGNAGVDLFTINIEKGPADGNLFSISDRWIKFKLLQFQGDRRVTESPEKPVESTLELVFDTDKKKDEQDRCWPPGTAENIKQFPCALHNGKQFGQYTTLKANKGEIDKRAAKDLADIKARVAGLAVHRLLEFAKDVVTAVFAASTIRDQNAAGENQGKRLGAATLLEVHFSPCSLVPPLPLPPRMLASLHRIWP